MNNLISIITSQFKLSMNSVHGLSHWLRVEALGQYLSATTEADATVVRYFAYLHDSCRISEGEDLEHGKRATGLIKELMEKGKISLTKEQGDVLKLACEVHNVTYTDPMDSTIATCLDADRLDLWRMGIEPSDKLLFTEVGKRISRDKALYDQIIGSATYKSSLRN